MFPNLRIVPPSYPVAEWGAVDCMVRYSLFAAGASVIWAIIAVVSMTYGMSYNWPDFVHANYGFPLTFATHTLNTIAGPVDRWSLDLGALTVDLTVWLVGMLVLLLAGVYLEGRSLRPREQAK